jgi:hypothetical protein
LRDALPKIDYDITKCIAKVLNKFNLIKVTRYRPN